MNKNQKGITLIALIITIIVMLILVAVTINVAINGGLFERAKDAKEKTQREADREELLSSVYATLNDKGDLRIVSELGNNLPQGWNAVEATNTDYLKCTSAKNEVFYVNKTTGAILNELPTAGGGGAGGGGDDNPPAETRYNVKIGDLFTDVEWTQVFTERNSAYTYIIFLIPDGKTEFGDGYQLVLEFDENGLEDTRYMKIADGNSIALLKRDNVNVWVDKSTNPETVTNELQINNALIKSAAEVNSGINSMKEEGDEDDMFAVPDAYVSQILNLTTVTPSNTGN